MSVKRYNDRIAFNRDEIVGNHKHSTLWAKTEVLGGYELSKALNGISVLGETVFSESNMVPIGGVQYAMEMIFGITGGISVPTLYDDAGIGLPNAIYVGNTVGTPDGERVMPYPYGNNVLLFGVGITGSAENNTTELPVSYRENSINMNLTTADGTTLSGLMLPFRYTSSVLSAADQKQYFGKKSFADNVTGYYLKRFESEPAIHHLWKTGEDQEGEVEVENNEVWDSTRTNDVETFTEIVLKLSQKDLKEYFTANGEIERTRFNTIALFSGFYNTEKGDYENVRLFSKLHIPVENLSLSKDLDIIYRVYGS